MRAQSPMYNKWRGNNRKRDQKNDGPRKCWELQTILGLLTLLIYKECVLFLEMTYNDLRVSNVILVYSERPQIMSLETSRKISWLIMPVRIGVWFGLQRHLSSGGRFWTYLEEEAKRHHCQSRCGIRTGVETDLSGFELKTCNWVVAMTEKQDLRAAKSGAC